MDITNLKDSEKELIKARDEANRLSKIKDNFIGNISHEIRTPLNAINGFTSLTKSRCVEMQDETSIDFLQIVLDSSKRLERTINLMLDFSKLSIGDIELSHRKIDLKHIIDNIIRENRLEAQKKSIRIDFIIETDNTEILLDENSIENALSNIISNAIVFTNVGFVEIILFRNKIDDLILKVQDTGVGISDEYMENIFEPYSQEDYGYTRSFEGVGLGLSVSKKLLMLNGADIQVQSEKGEGTLFTIVFKNEFQQNIQEDLKPKVYIINEKVSKFEKRNILLVEDDEASQELIKSILNEIYNLKTVGYGLDAIEYIKNNKVDLILMDISLKGSMDGLQLTKKLKQEYKFKDIPIIAVTAHATSFDKKNAFNAGCDDYISKPFSIRTILNKISSILNQDEIVK